jgi:hypothetical protein
VRSGTASGEGHRYDEIGKDASVTRRSPCGRPGTARVVIASLLVACVMGPSVAASPARALPAGLSDRTIKVCLAERLAQPPQLMILGSSRAEKVEPSLVQALTGLSAFNAGVSGGTLDDAWAFANFLHALPGARTQRVLWFLDVEELAQTKINPGLLATPQLARFVRTPPAPPPPVTRRCTARSDQGTRYDARGFRAHDYHDSAVERGVSQSVSLANSLAHYRTMYARYGGLVPAVEHRFEQTVALINSWGATPVIVLTPLHPGFAQAIGEPWTRMHRNVVNYLASLRPKLELDVIDASSIRTFGGSAGAFYDGVHLKVENARQLVRYVVRRAHRYLRPGP